MMLARIKYLLLYFGAILLISGTGCSKSDTATPANATMSATINGTSVSFTVSITKSNGLTVVQGSSNRYTLTVVLGSLSPSVFTLAAQSTNYYATLVDNLGGSYTTDASNTGQITLTQSGNLYNGTFYFNANETTPSAGNIGVTNGSCSNI